MDHGLRAESALEARWARDQAAGIGLQPHVLEAAWPQGQPDRGRLLAAARSRRYSLLLQKCRELGIATLLIAHHAGAQMAFLHKVLTDRQNSLSRAQVTRQKPSCYGFPGRAASMGWPACLKGTHSAVRSGCDACISFSRSMTDTSWHA